MDGVFLAAVTTRNSLFSDVIFDVFPTARTTLHFFSQSLGRILQVVFSDVYKHQNSVKDFKVKGKVDREGTELFSIFLFGSYVQMPQVYKSLSVLQELLCCVLRTALRFIPRSRCFVLHKRLTKVSSSVLFIVSLFFFIPFR